MRSAPRIGLIGARRVRQGLGPYVARDLCAAGAAVPCFLGTSQRSVNLAGVALREQGIDAKGYTELGEMLHAEGLDALAILGPHETHQQYLDAALRYGLHVLCEKPLLFGGEALAERAAEIVAGFAERGLLLRENCQWPYTLAAYRELFPDAPRVPRRFDMRLSPADVGAQMLVDSISHPLSLIQAILPEPPPEPGRDPALSDSAVPELRAFAFHYARGSVDEDRRTPAELLARFEYPVSGGPALEVEIRLVESWSVPRAAGYGLDGRFAEREVREPGYEIYLTAGPRAVKVRDPLAALAEDFVGDLLGVAGGAKVAAATAVRARMAMFEQIVVAFRASREEMR